MRTSGTPGSDQPPPIGAGAHAHVWELATPLGMRVVKVSDVALAAREAQVLTHLAGSGLAPRLVAAGEGILITERIPGRPEPPERWGADQATALGGLLHRLHRLPLPSELANGLDTGRVRDAQIAEIRRECLPRLRDITETAIAALPPAGPDAPVLLHGDPWSGNVVWGSGGPVLVDWEYARPGEPAQDLAYLSVMDALPDATVHAVLLGYGADATLVARVDAWRPLMTAWCGSWFIARGDADRGARLVAHAERLSITRAVGPSPGG